MRLALANKDKPHRCPICHGIRAEPRARWWRTHSCPDCGVFWWRGL